MIMKQSNVFGFFCLAEKTVERLSGLLKSVILTGLLVFGLQSIKANDPSEGYNVEMLQTTISGTVTDADGAPLPGANVVVKGSTNGTQTDFDGNYSIDAASNATLVFSYIGFAAQEIPVNGQTTINVRLSEDANQLSEVVVLGYSTQTRGDVTGSVASVDVSEATKAPIINASEALEGRVTGVRVVNTGNPGSPPRIVIRGFGTSNNTNPLYIIDGLQTDDANILNSINPQDIDQINVLKDAAAAIYGARASNGVVIVTTKSGGYNMEKPIVSVDAYTGIARVAGTPDLLNVDQHANMIRQSLVNDGSLITDGSAGNHGQYDPDGDGVFSIPNTLQGYTRVDSYDPITRAPRSATVRPGGTDWIDAITQTAQTQSVSVSIMNGSETGKYFLSANYLNRDGPFLETGFQQGTTRLNAEFKIGEKVIIGEHLNVSFARQRSNNTRVNDALRMSPLIPVYDDEGDFAGTGGASLSNTRSPVAQLIRAKDDFNKTFRAFGDIYLQAEVVDNLKFKTTFSGQVGTLQNRRFTALDPEHIEPLSTNQLVEFDLDGFIWTWNNTLNYVNSFGEHDLNVLVGVEAVEDGTKAVEINRSGFLFETPDFYLLDNGTGAPQVNPDNTFDGETSLFSIFGTLNYDYAEKYFATVTIRNDKSSRFLGDNQSQTFPSFSAGWVVSKEDFFPQNSFINRLKLKGSWGQLGNQTLPANNPTINISNLNEQIADYSLNGGSISTGAILSQVGNPDLRWETSQATNFGLEAGMFDDNLTLSFEWYKQKTIDLINRDNNLISTTAIDAQAPLVNLGDVQNTGIDFAIGYKGGSADGFKYGIEANISHYKNEVTKWISDFTPGRDDLRGGPVNRTLEGEPISVFFGREVTGFDDNGRFTYRDVDGDGDVDDDDRTIIGSPHPDFTFGLNFVAEYKGFDASVFFTGSVGNDVYNYEKIFTDFPTFFLGNRSTRVLDSWTPDNTDATLPALSQSVQGVETQPNSYFVEDASFVRLRNLQIGYTFPDNIAETIGMDNFRIYLQGSNLLTITDYEGFDPEVIPTNNLSLGIDFGNFGIFPLSQIYTFGINAKF